MAGAHYYDHEGNLVEGARITDVRRDKLLVSVTTFIKMVAKPGLEKWKIDERLKIAHNLMKSNPDLPLDDFLKMVQVTFDKQNDAADRGTMIHDILEQLVIQAVPIEAMNGFFRTYADKEIHGNYQSVYMAYDWFRKTAVGAGKAEHAVLAVDEGYAGRLDYTGMLKDPNGEVRPGMHDWKSQRVKNPGMKKNGTGMKKPKVNKYEDWALQLGAYAKREKAVHGYIGVVGTDPSFPFFLPIHYELEDLQKGYLTFRHLQQVFNFYKGL